MPDINIKIDETFVAALISTLPPEERAAIIEKLKTELPVTDTVTNSDISDIKEQNSDYLQQLRNTYDYGQEEFDKNILYVSSSALGLTLAFIEKIIKIDTAHNKNYLFNGWCLLGITILLYVLSHLASTFFIQRLLSIAKSQTDATPPGLIQDSGSYKICLLFGKSAINGFNIVLYILMTIGIVYILIFIHNNITL